jgi:two-component system catabolic regulation response regulator CreB
MQEAPLILVVEDDPPVADTLLYALESDGFRGRWCATGEAGLAAVQEASPALIVLDVGLPDMDGFAFCRVLRRQSLVPVLFLTARCSEVDRVVGLELGGDDYVTKPFSPREVTARVKAILRRVDPSAADADRLPPPVATPFQIDGERFRIRFMDRPLPLSRTEYRLLEVLVGRPGQVFTRGQLLDRAWDEPDASMERTVDAHVKSLRAKLHAAGAPADAICTVRGVGYSLRETW